MTRDCGAPGTGTPGRRPDDGFTVIEVLVALALFAVLATATLAGVGDAVGLARANEGRVTAADLASRVLETTRAADPTVVPPASQQVTVGGVAYTVTRTVESVEQAGSAVRCGVTPDRTIAQRLRVGVDWPGRRPGDAPVRLASLRTVDLNAVAPNAGTLYVVVEDADGAAVSGVTVTLAPGGITATSDASGCAIFPALAPRSDYVATLTKAGHADPTGVTQPSRGPLVVVRGGVLEELFVYSPHIAESPPGAFTVTPNCAVDPVPAFRAVSSIAYSGTTTTTLSKPTGVMAGDLMVAQVVVANSSIPTPPAGWTTVSVVSDAGTHTQGIYYRWATSSAPATYSWTHTSSKTVGGIAAYSGVWTKNPIDAVASLKSPSGTKAKDAPSVTTTTANTRLVAFYSAVDSGSFTPAPTMTERYDLGTSGGSSASNVYIMTSGEPWPTAGATGVRTAQATSSSPGITHMLALAPTRTPNPLLSWTASSWPSAEGYYLRRTVGDLLQRDWTVSGRATTSSTDGPLVNGTSYLFELSAFAGSSRTDPVTAAWTPDC